MSLFRRLLGSRQSEPVAPEPVDDPYVWWSKTDAERNRYIQMFVDRLRHHLNFQNMSAYVLDDKDFCCHRDYMCIEYIPYQVLVDMIKTATERPFVLVPHDRFHLLIFVQNLERVTSILPPSAHIAKACIRDAISRRYECPITKEKLDTLDLLCVGICGHVFSQIVSREANCPLCREPVSWATVKREDLD